MYERVLHEFVELAKGLAWPVVVLYCARRYHRQISGFLVAVSAAVGRLEGAKGFGVELELAAKAAEQASIDAEREQAVKILPQNKPPDLKGDEG